ncbi:hypothetical protein [Anaerotignum sp.]|uniref:hypothetical protein n=1 Tax=Anaerotignum sp. TaxID=2039241 RepID=UPI002ED4D887
MEWMGWFCFIIMLCYSSYPGKVKKLESKVRKLERSEGGETLVSKLIMELIGKNCKIKSEEDFMFSGNAEVECSIIDADDEWIKLSYSDKKGVVRTKIVRIDAIKNVEMISE